MSITIQPQRQALATFRAPSGAEIPVYITTQWYRALNEALTPAPAPAPTPAPAPSPAASPIPSGDVLANISGAAAVAKGTDVSSLLDAIFGQVQGSLLFRSAAGWNALGPSTSGYMLRTNGTNADPSWNALPASGMQFSYGSSSPAGPNVGDVWVDADTGVQYQYINDGNSSQWVEF